MGESAETFAWAIWEGSSAGVVGVDRAGRVVLANPAARRLLGLAGRVEGTELEKALAGHPRLLEMLRDALAGRPVPSRAELACHDAEGEARTLGLSVSRVAAGGAALVFRDLTPIEREGERERLHERLMALGGMAAGLAHELRTPLASMEVAAGLLQRRLAGDDDSLALVSDLRAGLRRLSDSVTASLDFLRPMVLRPEPVDPRALLDEALASAMRRASAPVEVRRCYQDALPPLEADPTLLGTALVNLVLNACEAMAAAPQRPARLVLGVDARPAPERTRALRVDGEARPVDGEARPARPASPLEVCIAVSDTGPGIPADLRDRIFDPFYTTKAAGTGIGLGQVQKVVAAHGGTLTVESGDAGSCFRVHLPATTGPGTP